MTLIKYSKRALADLESIYLTIFKDKKSVADNFINKIDNYIALLESNPFMGKDCRKKGFKKDCRVIIYDAHYMIFYKITTQYITIQRVVNTKQNYKG